MPLASRPSQKSALFSSLFFFPSPMIEHRFHQRRTSCNSYDGKSESPEDVFFFPFSLSFPFFSCVRARPRHGGSIATHRRRRELAGEGFSPSLSPSFFAPRARVARTRRSPSRPAVEGSPFFPPSLSLWRNNPRDSRPMRDTRIDNSEPLGTSRPAGTCCKRSWN